MEADPSVGFIGTLAPEGRGTLFELEALGGAFERRFRRMRPEYDEMPWGTLDVSDLPEAETIAARKAWTGAAFQEYRTAVACTATLRALLECKAPVDLVALATRFPLDEMVHVELCARMAMELGGGTDLRSIPIESSWTPTRRSARSCARRSSSLASSASARRSRSR